MPGTMQGPPRPHVVERDMAKRAAKEAHRTRTPTQPVRIGSSFLKNEQSSLVSVPFYVEQLQQYLRRLVLSVKKHKMGKNGGRAVC